MKRHAIWCFLGTYSCAICKARVRVYEYLPIPVLWAKCKAKIVSAERKMEERTK